MSDPFDEVTPPAYRTGDHETSIAAAEAVGKVSGKIARAVLSFARQREPFGFTDDNLKWAHPDAPESSYRKRRTELVSAGYLVSYGDTRPNRNGRAEMVWHITDKGRLIG